MQTLGLRPYKREDADTILSWSTDEKGFYQWSAGIMGKYPIAREEFSFVDSLMAFTAFDENGIVGFFTLRNPEGKTDEGTSFGQEDVRQVQSHSSPWQDLRHLRKSAP